MCSLWIWVIHVQHMPCIAWNHKTALSVLQIYFKVILLSIILSALTLAGWVRERAKDFLKFFLSLQLRMSLVFCCWISQVDLQKTLLTLTGFFWSFLCLKLVVQSHTSLDRVVSAKCPCRCWWLSMIVDISASVILLPVWYLFQHYSEFLHSVTKKTRDILITRLEARSRPTSHHMDPSDPPEHRNIGDWCSRAGWGQIVLAANCNGGMLRLIASHLDDDDDDDDRISVNLIVLHHCYYIHASVVQ